LPHIEEEIGLLLGHNVPDVYSPIESKVESKKSVELDVYDRAIEDIS